MSKGIKELEKLIKANKDLAFFTKLYQEFPEAKVLLVGGAVRDFLLDREIGDLDFIVEGVKKKDLAMFLDSHGKVKDIESRAFGVFIFKPENGEEHYEIALPRSDKWTGKGYKDLEVDIGVDIKEDLKRRDYTINALAVDFKTFKLIDLFSGQKDLAKGVIKAVGQAKDRFSEDPSRILRGIRIACELDFKIEKKTLLAMKANHKEVRTKLDNGKYRVAEEVIGEEFIKSFSANTVRTIELYDQVGLLNLLLPEITAMKGVEQPKIYHSEGDVFKHTMLALKVLEEIQADSNKVNTKELVKTGMLDQDFSIELKLALLFHDIGKPATFTPLTKEKNRISFNGHDDLGAEMTKKIIKRLKLTVFPKNSKLHVNKEQAEWLVRKHMVLVTAKPEEMRLSTLEKYFFNPDHRGQKIITLSYCDITATVGKNGPDYELLIKFLKQISKVKTQVKAKQKQAKLPKPLLNGKDIMKVLDLKSGPKVGKILNQLRDKELAGELKTKEQALAWLKENHN